MARPEIVLVTTFHREELLYLSLEAIRRADPDVTVRVYSDRGHHSYELVRACEDFGAELRIRGKHAHFGNSFNTLSAMETILAVDDPEILHLVEDDTLVHPKYFDWARRQLTNAKVACAYAHLSADEPREDWYESPCLSWKPKFLREALAMVPEDYFGDSRAEMIASLRRVFPKAKKDLIGEQDALFQQCIRHFKWRTIHPPRPLAQHVGWYGYNRGPAEPMYDDVRPFEERVASAREFVADRGRRSLLFGKRITDLEYEGADQ